MRPRFATGWEGLARAAGRAAVVFVAAVIAVVFVASVARADAQPVSEPISEPVRFEYTAFVEPCPAVDELFARVAARTALSPARPGEAARTFRVILAAADPAELGVTGVLEVIEPDGSTSARMLVGATCDEAVSAIALVAALAIEERAAAARPPDAATTSRTPPAASVPISPPAASSGTSGVRFWIGASFDLAVGRTPDALFGGALSLGATWRDDVPATITGPDLRLALAVAPSASVAVNGQSARFTFWTARLEACPVAIAVARELTVAPCVVAEAGALVGAGENVTDARTVTRPWLAVGASVRARAVLLDGFQMDVGLALIVPATRDRFVFVPGTSVLTVPEVGGLFDLGGSFTIP